MITSSFNAGVDASVISLTSKHRSLEQLKRYATPDPNMMMKSALAIGKVASTSSDSGNQIDEEQQIESYKKQRYDLENISQNNQSSSGKIFYFQF